MMTRSVVAGIDIGFVSSKALIKDGDVILSHHIIPSLADYKLAAENVLSQALAKANLSLINLSYVVSTGVGAPRSPFSNHQSVDISCQGKGINWLFPSARTIIDIGGQSSRVIKVNAQGEVTDFVMSEKCAGGSGRFLQIIARVLQLPLEDISPLSLKSQNAASFTTGCAVFAESEVISRISEGIKAEDIVAGVYNAIAAKISTLAKRIKLEPECVLTGGGAKNIGLVKSISGKLTMPVLVPDEPQITAALGAALIAQKRVPL